jgi:hypothetical protein
MESFVYAVGTFVVGVVLGAVFNKKLAAEVANLRADLKVHVATLVAAIKTKVEKAI